MKRLLALFLSLCLLLTVAPAASAAGTGMAKTQAEAAVEALNAGSDFYYELADDYADSEIEYRSEVRWWMAEGGHTDQTLEEEVQAMYDAGFRGVELCQLNVSGMDASTWGYGSEQWNHDFHVVLNKCMDLGMTVGITSGTNWNTSNVPGLNPDSQAAMQTVLEMHETVSGGTVLENHAVPTSKTSSGGCGGSSTITVKDAAQWVGAYAYKVVDASAKPQVLGEPIDVSSFVTEQDGMRSISWTVPADGEYQIFYLWMQGTYQASSPAVTPSYCVNYLDQRGFEAWAEYFKANVLNDPALNAKIKNGDVQLFMDSLEYNDGDGMTIYSEHFAEEFQKRKGYDIRPYLVLADGLPNLWTWNRDTYYNGTYTLTDRDLALRIHNDLFDVQTKLYMENLLEPMESWLNDYGIQLRAQISYGKYLEISEPSMAVDYPEAENLNQHNQVDMYRLWSGAAKLENKVLSSETGALGGHAYSFTNQAHLQEAYSLYAAGFSRINWHIWTSAWSPEAIFNPDSAGGGFGTPVTYWPGFQSMSMFNVLGLREPTYDTYWSFNQHLGRVQKLLREGTSRTDVGMIYMKYGQPLCTSTGSEADMWMQRHDTMLFPSTKLQDNGYTYDYFSPALLKSEDVSYNAETGTLELAGYKALVLWQDCLTAEGAKDILKLAQQGLKVVIVDGAAIETPYNDQDADLAQTMDALKALDNVRTAASADDVLAVLQAMGVEPYAGFESMQLLSQVRADENGNEYLYLYNYCDGSLHDGDDPDHGLEANTEVVMDGTFIPYCIDSWTGEVTQAADYRWENGKTILPIDLIYGDIALYAFEAVDNEPEHVVSSDLESYVTENGIVVRAAQSGTYETKLAYGRSVKTTVEVPAAYDITNWDVTVESWTPGDDIEVRQDTFADSNGVSGIEKKVSTKKTDINVKLDKLTTWDNIPEVGKAVSGKGSYKASFQWDGTADGAYIDFGTVVNGMSVKINGTETNDINVNSPVLDVTDYLVVGENTIELDYSSTLTNVLIELGKVKVGQSNWAGKHYYRDYRSYGPAQAVVVPYVEQNISVLENNDVTVNLTGKSDVTVDVPALSYDVSVSGAEKLATATLTFNVEGLVDPTVEPAEGWYLMGQSVDNGVLTAVIGNNAGLTGEGVIATLTAKTTGKVGTAKVELAKAALSAYVGEGETFTNVIYGTTSVETKIDYSTYDVNHDGVVNQLDLTRAQRYYGKADAVCDVNHDGVVDISDLILILNNYTK